MLQSSASLTIFPSIWPKPILLQHRLLVLVLTEPRGQHPARLEAALSSPGPTRAPAGPPPADQDRVQWGLDTSRDGDSKLSLSNPCFGFLSTDYYLFSDYHCVHFCSLSLLKNTSFLWNMVPKEKKKVYCRPHRWLCIPLMLALHVLEQHWWLNFRQPPELSPYIYT